MKVHGAFTSLVSGGFTYFADHIGKRIGFDEAMANILEFDGDALSGTVADPILGKEAKLSRLMTLAAFHDIPLAATLAVGDGANDLDMKCRPDVDNWSLGFPNVVSTPTSCGSIV